MAARWRSADDVRPADRHLIVRIAIARRQIRHGNRTHDARALEAHDWRAAGEAWGSRANDWSCLYEHYSIDVLIALVREARRRAGRRRCSTSPAVPGSPCARRRRWARPVAGIDAAADLIAVARERTPTADLRVGSMYALPWADESFDAAVSVNGIWGGCDAALDEAFRVLRPGGLIGISFWGTGPPLDIRTFFRIFAVHAPAAAPRVDARSSTTSACPGVAEEMLTASGFSVLERGGRTSVIEWPDAEIAWRAISSLGPAVPALRTNDPSALRARGARRARAVPRRARHLPHAKRPAVRRRRASRRRHDGGAPVTPVAAEIRELGVVEAEQLAQHLVGVLAEARARRGGSRRASP